MDDCKQLVNEYTIKQKKNYAKAHAEYYKRNKDAMLEYQRQYYRNTAEKRAQDRKDNPEKYRAQEARKREKRGDKLREYNREYQRERRRKLKATAHGAEIEAPANNEPAGPVPTKEGD